MPGQTITRVELADLIEEHAGMLARALRGAHVRTSGAVANERTRPTADGGEGAPEPERSAAPGPMSADDPDAASSDAAAALGTWSKVGELPNQTHTWPQGPEQYEPFEVWEKIDGRGRIQIGLGRSEERGEYYGKERGYWVAFEMINRQKRRAIVIFNEADDFETSGDLVAIIKGKGEGGRSMFAPGDELPAGYEGMEVDIFRERINGPQAYNRLAVIATGGNRQAMCEHAFMQLRLRS